MATISSLWVSLSLQADNFNNGLKDAQREAKEFEKTIKPTTKLLDDMGAAMTSAGQTMTIGLTLPIVAFGVAAVSNFNDAAKASALMENAIRSTGGAAGKSADELRRLATSLQGNSIFDDDQIIGRVLTQLLTFTKVSGEAFDRGAQAALNMSTILEQDLQSSAIQVGKALNDPVAGVTALQRVGVKLDDTQKDLIKSFMAVNDVAGAQNVILTELEKQFGGAAEAASKAGSGPMTQLWVKIGNLTESWGELISKAIIPFIQHANTLVDWLNTLDTSTKAVVLVIAALAAAVGPVLLVLGTMASSLSGLMVLYAKFAPLVSELGGAMSTMGASATAAGVGTSALSLAISGLAVGIAVAAILKVVDAYRELKVAQDNLVGANDGLSKATSTMTEELKKRGIEVNAQLGGDAKYLAALQAGVLASIEASKSGKDFGTVLMSVTAEQTKATAATTTGTAALIPHAAATEKVTAAARARIAEDERLVAQFMTTRAAEQQNAIVTSMFAANLENATRVTQGLRTAQLSLADGNDKLEQMMHAADLADESIVGLGGAMAGLKAIPPPVWAPDLDAANDAALRLAETAKNNLKAAVNDVRESAGKIFDDMLIKGEGVFNSLKNALSGGALSLGRSIFQDITSEVFGPILDEFRKSVMAPIKEAFSDLFSGVMDSIKGSIKDIGSSISGAFVGGAGGVGGGISATTATVTAGIGAAALAAVAWIKSQAHWEANTFVKEFQGPVEQQLAQLVALNSASLTAGTATTASVQATIDGITKIWTAFQASAAEFGQKGSDASKVATQGLDTIRPLIESLLSSAKNNLDALASAETKTTTATAALTNEISGAASEFASAMKTIGGGKAALSAINYDPDAIGGTSQTQAGKTAASAPAKTPGVDPNLIPGFLKTPTQGGGLNNPVRDAAIAAAQLEYVRAAAIPPPQGIFALQQAAAALQAAMAMPAYDRGSSFVQQTGPAIVHRGERVVTASDNESLTDLLREMIAIGKANLAAVREKTKLYVDGKDLARNQAGHLYDLTRNEGVVLIGRR